MARPCRALIENSLILTVVLRSLSPIDPSSATGWTLIRLCPRLCSLTRSAKNASHSRNISWATTGKKWQTCSVLPTVTSASHWKLHLTIASVNYLWNQRTLADLEQSIDYYQQAILLAPDFAPACAALGDVYAVISIRGRPPPSESYPRARDAAEKALQLDDSLADAHALLDPSERIGQAHQGNRFRMQPGIVQAEQHVQGNQQTSNRIHLSANREAGLAQMNRGL